jgi:isochorismate synthase
VRRRDGRKEFRVTVDAHASRSAAATFVAASLTSRADSDAMRVITVPAPSAPLTAILKVLPRTMSVLWNPQTGLACAGGGVAYSIPLAGGGRFAQLREGAAALWPRLHLFRHPEAAEHVPRLIGGLAFSAGFSDAGPWREFGDGCMTLPRWTYGRDGDDAFLSLAISAADSMEAQERTRALAELETIIDVLSNREPATGVPLTAAANLPLRIEQMPLREWVVQINGIRQEIAAGRLRKAVAARRCRVVLSREIDDLEVLRRYMEMEQRCTHYAFRQERASFIGGSPEILFSKTGLVLRTQALAGTIRVLDSDEARREQGEILLASEKDREEHHFVVRTLRDVLSPFCSEITVASTPEILKLRDVLHLNTPFSATLRPGADPVEILGALHPTPAVGGVPGPYARDWIVEHEREHRGWYSGPIGWLDQRGDAEFAVAIRCGVIAAADAYVYTGAGIVLNSDPHAEYEETALKQLPMLRALGVKNGEGGGASLVPPGSEGRTKC